MSTSHIEDLRSRLVLAQVSVPETMAENLVGEIALIRDATDERIFHTALNKH